MNDRKRWLWIGLAAGVALIAVKLLRSRVAADRTLEMDSSPEHVWRILSDFQQWPEWNQGMAFLAAERGFPLGLGDRFTWSDGRRAFDSTVYQLQPNRALAITAVSPGVTLDLRFELQPAGQGTRVAMRESLDGVLPRLLSGIFQHSLENQMEAWLWQLKVAVE